MKKSVVRNSAILALLIIGAREEANAEASARLADAKGSYKKPTPKINRRAQLGVQLRSLSQMRQRSRMYEPMIAQAAARHNVDPNLLWTIAYLETRFRPGAVSPEGARGLMQFMPQTAKSYGLTNPHNVAESIDAAARHAHDLNERFDNRSDLVLAAYNAGEHAVAAYREGQSVALPSGRIINRLGLQTNGIPPYRQTRRYVARAVRVLQSLKSAQIFTTETAHHAGKTRPRYAKPRMISNSTPIATLTRAKQPTQPLMQPLTHHPAQLVQNFAAISPTSSSASATPNKQASIYLNAVHSHAATLEQASPKQLRQATAAPKELLPALTFVRPPLRGIPLSRATEIYYDVSSGRRYVTQNGVIVSILAEQPPSSSNKHFMVIAPRNIQQVPQQSETRPAPPFTSSLSSTKRLILKQVRLRTVHVRPIMVQASKNRGDVLKQLQSNKSSSVCSSLNQTELSNFSYGKQRFDYASMNFSSREFSDPNFNAQLCSPCVVEGKHRWK